MTIEQRRVIDILGVNKEKDEATLFISDHLDWDDPKNGHLLMLQEKINDYLAAIESGELVAEYPNAQGKRVVIEVIGKYPLSDIAKKFYEKASAIVGDAGFDLRFSLAKE